MLILQYRDMSYGYARNVERGGKYGTLLFKFRGMFNDSTSSKHLISIVLTHNHVQKVDYYDKVFSKIENLSISPS